MAGVLAALGPDDSNCWTGGPCGLAHTRLSIIDIAGSVQPMGGMGSQTALVYNGELYNYKELRSDLARDGVAFQTAGDTEVVLRYVDRLWEAALHRVQ